MEDTETIVASETPAGDTQDAASSVPAVEAFAHAMAITAHQHAAATPEDAPGAPARLPFPRAPFDVEKHLLRIFEKRAEIRALTVECLRADEAAKRAAKTQKLAHQSLATAHTELDELIDLLEEDRRASDDEPEQLALHEPGRAPCSWEREHPGEVCHVCATGGNHNGDGDGDITENRLQLATGEEAHA
jgi:hypothetical protein